MIEGERLDPTSRLRERFAEHGGGLTEEQRNRRKLPLGDILTAPEVFQPRDFEEYAHEKETHIQGLVKALEREGDLDPITVFAIGGKCYLLDGHCRLRAYEISKKTKAPVHFFAGSFADALLHSAEANTKDKLPLTLSEKLEAAWRLAKHHFRTGAYSYRTIARASGVAPGTVGNMVATLRANPGFLEETWADVLAERRGANSAYTEDAHAEKVERYVKALGKAFGKRGYWDREAIAEALHLTLPWLEAYTETDF